MSATELLEQVKALPPEERRSFFAAVHEVEKAMAVEEPAERQMIDSQNVEAYSKKLDTISKFDTGNGNFNHWLTGKDLEKVIEPKKERPFPDFEARYRKLHELGMPYWTEEQAADIIGGIDREDMYP